MALGYTMWSESYCKYVVLRKYVETVVTETVQGRVNHIVNIFVLCSYAWKYVYEYGAVRKS
jgi:hypothetical protein